LTLGQAEVIFDVLPGKTQEEFARVVGIDQAAVKYRLRLATWKG
jgi:hypothetical protein